MQSFREDNCWVLTLLSEVVPVIVVKSNAKPVTAEVLSKQHWETAFHANADLLRWGYSIGILKIWATDRFLYFPYRDARDWYSVYWDYVACKGYKCRQYIRGNIFMPGNFLASTSNAFIASVSALDFLTTPEGIGKKRWLNGKSGLKEYRKMIIQYYCFIL